MTAQGRPPLPPPSSDSYLWYEAGATENQRLTDEGLSFEQKDVRAALEALARLNRQQGTVPPLGAEDLVLLLARIYCPDKLRRTFR